MGHVLKHPLARGVLNCAWPTVTRASGTARETYPPSSGRRDNLRSMRLRLRSGGEGPTKI